MITNTVIKLRNIDIYQQKHLVLSNVNIQIDSGEFVFMIGQTGSGKSSLLKVIYGDLPVSTGDGLVAGFDLGKLHDRDIPFLRRKLGIVFQDFHLLTDRTVEKNLEFVMRATGWKDKNLIRERMFDVLDKVGLRSKLKKMPHELSGGEQQRVVIARALLNDPEVILADEPTGNLDPNTSEEIVLLLKEISRAGTAVLMATHDYQIIRNMPSRIVRTESGLLQDNVSIS
ncbi:cell division ATP-binding protein FtsE [Olivibacter domesticus]|uniref:Cell division ATP-binding protein FtsE n=1 Tax=Olivibacter domesticus TaxID=407022 RepID=A0A1H7PKH9_OLID1|nr:ATP-binding cassette domain-containing protein [Olivibacter domesticus]SEL35934.1 cell division transport system ATP-binding protein [Olivibacter domesticus]